MAEHPLDKMFTADALHQRRRLVDVTKIRPTPKICERCRFWQAWANAPRDDDPTKPMVGDCRRGRPSITGDRRYGDKWPMVRFDDWCGEWLAKP
jgi:hypothetical protein